MVGEKLDIGLELSQLCRADDNVVNVVGINKIKGIGAAGVDGLNVFDSVGVIDTVAPEPAWVAHDDLAASKDWYGVIVGGGSEDIGTGWCVSFDPIGQLKFVSRKHGNGLVGVIEDANNVEENGKGKN